MPSETTNQQHGLDQALAARFVLGGVQSGGAEGGVSLAQCSSSAGLEGDQDAGGLDASVFDTRSVSGSGSVLDVPHLGGQEDFARVRASAFDQSEVGDSALASSLAALGFDDMDGFAESVERGPTQSQCFVVNVSELDFIPGQVAHPVLVFNIMGKRYVVHEKFTSQSAAHMAAMLVCCGVRNIDVSRACGMSPDGLALPERTTSSDQSKHNLGRAVYSWLEQFKGCVGATEIVPWFYRSISDDGVVCEYDDQSPRSLHPVYYQTRMVSAPYSSTYDYAVATLKWSVKTGKFIQRPIAGNVQLFSSSRSFFDTQRAIRSLRGVFFRRVALDIPRDFDAVLQLALFPCDPMGAKATSDRKKYAIHGDAVIKQFITGKLVVDDNFSPADVNAVVTLRLSNANMGALFGVTEYAACCVVPSGVTLQHTKTGATVFEVLLHLVYRVGGMSAVERFFFDVDPNRGVFRL